MPSNNDPNPVLYRILRSPFCLFFALWLILMLASRSAMFRDPGTFWHVAVGENIISTRQVPREDLYSYTFSGHPWISDYWLAEIAMAAIHRTAGWDGLLTVTAAILAGIYAFIAGRLSRGGIHWLLVGAILALIFLASSHQFHVRPLVLTLAGLTIVFSLLVDVEAGRKSLHHLWLLAPLFVLWANAHGGVLAGVGSVGLCALGWFLLWAAGKDSPIQNFHHVLETLLLISVLLLSLLINPYGVYLIRSWFETLTMPLPRLIQEHGPLDLTSAIGCATLTLGLIYAIVLLTAWPQHLRITWLLPLVFIALAVRVRNTPLFAITAALALPDMLPYSRLATWLQLRKWLSIPSETPAVHNAGCHAHACRGHDTAPPHDTFAIFKKVFFPLSLVSIVLFFQSSKIPLPIFGSGWARFDPAEWPVELLPELQKINEKPSTSNLRIFNDLKFGGFLIYHTPNLKIFVDDRCSLYGSEFLLAYDSARRDDPGRIDLWHGRYQFEYALVEAGAPFDAYLRQSDRWILLGRSAAAALYQFHLGIPNNMN
jgi:hypothetical protein